MKCAKTGKTFVFAAFMSFSKNSSIPLELDFIVARNRATSCSKYLANSKEFSFAGCLSNIDPKLTDVRSLAYA
jgi:hypothetical protein